MRNAVLALAAAGALAGCGRAGDRGRSWPDAPVVIVSIDTLRADRIGAYGYAAARTPVLDALAREAVLFEDAYSHCPLTLPSHLSLLTGLLPPRHGVRDNIGFRLDASVTTLPEQLRGAGWATGAAISAFVLRGETGIGRGFDAFDDLVETPGGEESLGSLQRDGAQAVTALSRWLETAGERPLAFLHLYEPHSPWSPPERHRRGEPYDGEVAYADELLGRFLEALRARGLYERSILVLTSDHGEGLGDHGEQEHGIFLYREALRVPLLVRLPGGARGGTRVAGSVGLVDVMPTLLDLLSQPETPGLDGVTLRAALETGSAAPRPVYSETLYPRLHFGWSELFAVSEGRYRFIRAPRPELYDVASDPHERRDLAAERAGTAAAMGEWLERRLGTAPEPERVPEELREKLAALGYLGSGAANATGEAARPDPKDRIGRYEQLRRAMALRRSGEEEQAVALLRALLAVEPDMFDAWEGLATALGRLDRTAAAIEAWGHALALDPSRAGPHLALARLHGLEGRLDEAVAHAEVAAAREPGKGYELLAQLALDQRQPGRAAEWARRSVAADPRRAMSRFVLGELARGEGRCQDAVAEYRRAAEVNRLREGSVILNLHAHAGDCLARLGREAEAEREFLLELEQIPWSVQGRVGLGMLYRAQGRMAEARAAVTGLIDAQQPASADAYWTVVRGLAALGDEPAAREWAQRARQLFPADPRFR